MFWKPPLYNSVKGVAIGVMGVVELGNFVLSLYIDIGLNCMNLVYFVMYSKSH